MKLTLLSIKEFKFMILSGLSNYKERNSNLLI